MSADPNALLAFKQLNLKERVRVHVGFRSRRARSPAKNAKCFFPPPAPSSCDRPPIGVARALTDTLPPIIPAPSRPSQLEVYREEIALGEKAVAALKRQQAAYEERATVVATEWNALQAHVETLAARVTGGVDATNPNAAPDAAVEDPFLRRLVSAAGGDEAVAAKKRAREEADDDAKKAADKKRRGDATRTSAADAASGSDSEDEDGAARDVGGLDEDAKRTVDALRARAASVKQLLAKVLDAVDAANAKQTGSAVAASDESLSRDLERARARIAALDARAGLDAAALERFREVTAKQRKRNEELGKKLEDTVADVEMLRRQLRMARSDAGQIEGLPPMATAHSAKAAAAVAVSAAAGGGKDAGKDASGAAAAPAAAAGEGAPAGGADAEALAKLQGLVHELEGRLKASTAQVESCSSKCAALEGEARGLRDRLADESAVTSSRPFQSLEARLREQRDESARFRRAASDLQRDADTLRAELRKATTSASATAEAQRRAALAEARVHDAEARARAALDERDRAELALRDAGDTVSKRRLEEERAALIEKLREENKSLRAKHAEAVKRRAELDDAKLAAGKARADAEAARAEAADAAAALAAAKDKNAAGSGKTGDDAASLVAELREQLAAAQREASAASARASASDAALEEKNAESEAFMAEMEAIGAAYEEAASENARLMERLAERDESSTKALAEKNQAQMAARRLRDECAGMQAAVAHERGAAQAATTRAQQIEAAAREQSDELARAIEEKEDVSRRMEEQTKTLTQLRDTSESRREALENAERRAETLVSVAKEDAKRVAEAERALAKCEETCAGLRRRCEKLAKHGGSADEYKEEIDAYKSMLRCSVCNDRPKGVVITRCFHMFCNDCIATRLENRDRKCPGCGLMFSASDVKSIFF
jgi:E3 ubiquitin-protein ligase BRE1